MCRSELEKFGGLFSAPPPTCCQQGAENQPVPTHHAVGENHGTIEDHEHEKTPDQPTDPATALTVRCWTGHGPEQFTQPHQSEQVVQIQTAAPVPAGKFCGLSRRIGVSRGVTPLVKEMKRASDMRSKGSHPKCIQPASCRTSGRTEFGCNHNFCSNVQGKRQPDRAPGKPFRNVHALHSIAGARR